ncbi:uncharacterized protein LOC122808156 [Protopterus annectens]|uniref:uncharacterized protein LOC122808156 n=1 Tax=Protopterus annectens TaxID=7888 RepID=UPI001CFA12C3|nr:uncharacterized protein LOC122808156 [Protopterus annectens]
MSEGDTYAVVNKHNQKSPSVTRKANERGKKAPRLEEEPGYAYVGNHPVPSGAMRLTEIKNDVVIEEDSAYANVQACLSSPGDTNIMENHEVTQGITSTTKKSMTLRSWRGVFILMAAVILAIVVSFSALILQLSRQPELNNNELNIKLKESEDNITAMGRNQTGLQMLIKQAENKITAMGKNQTSLQILLQKSEDMITAMEKNQMSLQMLLKQAEEKLTVMDRTQSTLQIQLKQAEVNIASVKTKQSSLETKVSQAEQKITALQWNHGQKVAEYKNVYFRTLQDVDNTTTKSYNRKAMKLERDLNEYRRGIAYYCDNRNTKRQWRFEDGYNNNRVGENGIFRKQNEYDPHKYNKNGYEQNYGREENQRKGPQDSSIVIVAVNKGGAVVAQIFEDINMEVIKQLSNAEFYCKMSLEFSPEFEKDINEILGYWADSEVISKVLFKELTVQEPKS